MGTLNSRLLRPLKVVVLGLAVASGGCEDPREDLLVSVPRWEHDFGPVPVGPELSCEFELTNQADHPLLVDRIERSCGCLAAELSPRSVAPGGQARFRVVLSTAALSAPSQFARQVVLYGHQGPRRGELSFKLRAQLRPPLYVQPESIEVVPADEPVVRIPLNIYRDRLAPDDFARVEIETPGSYCKARVLHQNADLIAVELQLDWQRIPPLAKGLNLRFPNAERRQSVHVPLRCKQPTTQPRVEARPATFAVTVSDSEDLANPVRQRIELVSRSNQEVEIEQVVPQDVAEPSPFAWAVIDGEPGALEMWLDRLPAGRRIVQTVVLVSYRETETGRKGTIPVTAFVVGAP